MVPSWPNVSPSPPGLIWDQRRVRHWPTVVSLGLISVLRPVLLWYSLDVCWNIFKDKDGICCQMNRICQYKFRFELDHVEILFDVCPALDSCKSIAPPVPSRFCQSSPPGYTSSECRYLDCTFPPFSSASHFASLEYLEYHHVAGQAPFISNLLHRSDLWTTQLILRQWADFVIFNVMWNNIKV